MLELSEVESKELELELARIDFWSYCQLMHPKFYRDDRPYLKEFADNLQQFTEQNEKRLLVINMPPRHGKSFTAQNFTAWLFGNNPSEKVMTASYNERLSGIFARTVRNTIQTEKVSDQTLVYEDIFPETKVKRGEASASLWGLEGNTEPSYLATSPGATATGLGVSTLIIDDIIKSADEAYNARVLDDHWEWFNNTMLSRLEGDDWKVIIIMTRWAEGDLAGRVLSAYKDDVDLITYKAVQDDGSMLCDNILNRKDYTLKIQEMNLDIVEANYNQKPLDIGGRLYSQFKEWEKLPDESRLQTVNFTDTADTGTDYLCSISGIQHEGDFYVKDILFTDEPMEVTEPATVDLFISTNTTEATIESNNGGRGFSRNVNTLLEKRGKYIHIDAVAQTKNKESRILSSSAWVQNHILMPLNWKTKYPEFYKQVMTYQRKGKNAHDDAVDVLAMIYESMTNDRRVQIFNLS